MKKVMLARQPIFDAHEQTYAYELLYRGDIHNVSDEAKTAVVLSNTLNQFGMDTVTDGSPIFINLSKQFLLSEFPNLLPPERTVLEVLEDVPADEDVIAAMQYWKDKGFTLALDDFISVNSQHINLLPYADIVKIDILAYEGELETLVQELRQYPIKLLAEKVESYAQYKLCKKLGFDYYQGYFFSKPALMVDHHALDTNKAQLLQLLSRTLEAESPKDLESDITYDLALSYKLLCYINSAAVGLRKEINSIGHALNLMGLDNIRVWVSMLLMASLSKDKPDALLALSFTRGHFLEQLALLLQDDENANSYFILGMFSLLDALLDQSIEQAIESISLPELVRNGLLHEDSDPANRLNLIRSLEKTNWTKLAELLRTVGINDEQMSLLYSESVQWGDQRMASINAL